MKVCHLIPYVGRAQGGPVMAVAGLSRALAGLDCSVAVAAVARGSDGERAEFAEDTALIISRRSLGGMFRYSPALRRRLLERDFDVLHSHGLWTYAGFLAGRLASEKGIPHLLAPCGMLNEGALQRSRWKKAICRAAFQDRALMEAACLQAKSEAEYEDIRRFGLTNPVALIPNPVTPPKIVGEAGQDGFRREFGLPEGSKILLYLGRLHPVKGLERLMTAWSFLGDLRRDWRLVLAGPNENGYGEVLAASANRLGCSQTVTFTGPLNDSAKGAAFSIADLFVMPSDFENFGSAVAEALLCGLPVVTTTGTPWRALKERQCGWWVEPDAESLSRALREAMAMASDDRRRMGEEGRQLAAAFRPEVVGRQVYEVYAWLTGGRAKPQWVES